MKKSIVIFYVILILVGCSNDKEMNDLLVANKNIEEQLLEIATLKEELVIANSEVEQYEVKLEEHTDIIEKLQREIYKYQEEDEASQKVNVNELQIASAFEDSIINYFDCELFIHRQPKINKDELITTIKAAKTFYDINIIYDSLPYSTDNENQIYYESDGTKKKELQGWNIVNAGNIRTLDDLNVYLYTIFSEEVSNSIIDKYFSYDYNTEGNYLIYNDLLFTKGGAMGSDPYEIELWEEVKGKITYYSEEDGKLIFNVLLPIVYWNDNLEVEIDKIEIKKKVYEFIETEQGWKINSL